MKSYVITNPRGHKAVILANNAEEAAHLASYYSLTGTIAEAAEADTDEGPAFKSPFTEEDIETRARLLREASELRECAYAIVEAYAPKATEGAPSRALAKLGALMAKDHNLKTVIVDFLSKEAAYHTKLALKP